MREIKFRGYSEKMKIWCYGYYVEQSGYSYIVDFDTICETTKDFRDVFEDLSWSLVDEKSVGQYTGLKDMENREIYEGDIVEGHADGLGKVVWQGACWTYEFMDSNTVSLDEICIWFGNNAVVIGNIYENPELIEK